MRVWLPATFVTMLALVLLQVSACDSGNGDDTDKTPDLVSDQEIEGPETDQTAPGDVAPGDYPAGPYGTKVGDTIEDLVFYSPELGESVSFSGLRTTDKKLLLLTSGAGWCSACKQEATELEPKYDEYGPKGLEIWSTLFQDYSGDVADEPFWNQWNAQFNPNYPLLLDADFVLGAYFNPESAPMNMLIRLDTMEIIFLKTGFDPTAVESEVKKFLE